MSLKKKLLIVPRRTKHCCVTEGGKCQMGAIVSEKRMFINGKLYEGCTAEKNSKNWCGKISRPSLDGNQFSLVYTGDMVGNLPHGNGYHHQKNGSYYEGSFVAGKRSGHGRCWFPDGSFYDGQWLNNKQHGKGLLVMANGNRYEGEWKEGLKDGLGAYFHFNSGQLQKGRWTKDIAVTSTIEDMPYRVNAALRPTPVRIPPLHLDPQVPFYMDLQMENGEMINMPRLTGSTVYDVTEPCGQSTDGSMYDVHDLLDRSRSISKTTVSKRNLYRSDNSFSVCRDTQN